MTPTSSLNARPPTQTKNIRNTRNKNISIQDSTMENPPMVNETLDKLTKALYELKQQNER